MGPEDGTVVGWFHGQPGSRLDVRAFSDETLTRYRVRLMSIDRAGYGDTNPVGLDRRDVARDLLAVADHLGVGKFSVMAVSMGGVYALTLAALAPGRIARLVLISAHVLPYDDPKIIAGLSAAEQADLRLLQGGRTPELERAYSASAASMAKNPIGLLRELSQGWAAAERALVDSPLMRAVAESVAFGLGRGHAGMLEDGLRTVLPLEFELSEVLCPVRAIHGTVDDLEPFANLERAAAQLSDCLVLALPDMGHFAPWLWPDSIFGLLIGH